MQCVISGLVLGSVYAVMTVGLNIVFGCLRTFMMAQGSFVMIGGYAAWLGFQKLGLPPVLGLVLGVGVAAVFGVFTYVVAMHPLIGRKNIDVGMTAYISTLVVSILLTSSAVLLFGGRDKALPPLVEGLIKLPGNVTVARHSVLIAVVALGSLWAISVFLKKTRHGLSVNAVAQDLDAARLMGVHTSLVYASSFALAAGLGGLAGVLLAPLYFISPVSGDLPLLKGLIVAIFGGLGSMRGTVYAAFMIGLLESALSTYVSTGWTLPLLWGLIILVMMVRPYGLFGLPEEERL